MRDYRAFALTISVFSFLLVGLAWAFPGGNMSGPDYREGEILVKYRSGIGERGRGRVRSLVRARKSRAYKHVGIEKISLGAGMSALQAVDLLSSDPGVEYAELNWRVEYLAAPRLTPNDPGFTSGDQWYLDAPPIAGYHITPGNVVFIDRDIDAPEAWAVMEAVFNTTPAVSVGVLDSGCGELGKFSIPSGGYQPNHEDLPNSVLWTNPVEAADPGTDSPLDPNNFIDDVNGWDFIDNDNNMSDVLDESAPYHGTHISGLLAALWDNSVGVAGIGREQIKVLPQRILFIDEIIEAIDYAIMTTGDPQVKVLNASWKFDRPFQSLQDAITAAGTAGIAFVAAAGNGFNGIGTNNDNNIGILRVYPAEYTKTPLDNVLAVAATNIDGSLVSFSNYGPVSVQVTAPGVFIYSPSSGASDYTFVNGTSFAAPIAASALALVMAANPGIEPSQAIDRVVEGGDFDARLAGRIVSGKRINLAGALAPFAPYSGSAPVGTLTNISLYGDSVSALYGSISNAISDSPGVAVMVTTAGGAWAVSPVSPGLTTFNLEFDGVSAPVGTYGTGLWRVTGISPFSAQLDQGDSISFTSLIPGSIDWSVTNSTVGTIDSAGLFTALTYGTTQVVLNVDGQDVDNSGTILVLALDNDGDGFREDVDCDDTASAIFPGAEEICGDGVDNDCDGDIDGADSQCSGGGNGGGGGGSGGGCGTTSSPSGPYWPGAAGIMLVGTMLFLIRWRYQAALADPRSNIQDPRRR